MSIESYERQIAKIAKDHINELGNLTGKDGEEFANFLKGFPTSIMQNGLLQTILFVKGKKSNQPHNPNKYDNLFDLLQNFFNQKLADGELLNVLPDLENMETYLFYQTSFLVYASWLKRFCLALKGE